MCFRLANHVVLLILLKFVLVSTAAAELRVATVFSAGAVLQRDAAVPVWGTAKPGERVNVAFAGQAKIATASATGRWRVTLDPMVAAAQPRPLVITSPDNERITIPDIVVGEVWLCAGQSNMAMKVDRARDAETEKANSNLPLLRVFTVDYTPAREPVSDVSGSWVASTPETAGRFSATAFFFGRELHRKLGVPVGLVVAARSGSDIAAWTSHEAQENEPGLRPLLKSWAEKDAAYTPAVAAAERTAYQTNLSKWQQAASEAVTAGLARPKKPRRPVDPRDHWHHPAVLYNGMIAPLIPYAIRGVIWYQGETNAFTEETSALYEKQLPLLVSDWRARWNQGDFPMAWVQLPFSSAKKVAWARIRESMRRALVLPDTGMVVTWDLGEERLLHPLNKQAFSHRLALWARAQVYEEDIPWSGPMFKGYRLGERGIVLRFEHAEGLAAKDGPLIGFEVRTKPGGWRSAAARIDNQRVIVSLPPDDPPTAVRYAWANHPRANLINATHLPASPFMTEIAAATTPTTSARSRATKKKTAPADLTQSPLEPVDIQALPAGSERVDIFLLMGQSNMKGRGVMPANPLRDPRIVMMHRRTDEFYLARHPLHLVGDPTDFTGADNAGVGPGLSFAQELLGARPRTRVLLVPCAVGGTAIGKWKKGQRLYNETIRRAKLAVRQGPKGKTRIAGALWLQGESDSVSPERIAAYAANLSRLIDDLRADTGEPDLPFIACTIGEMRSDIEARKKINAILLDLPNHKHKTACVDGRAFAAHIGDRVHFDTPTQQEHGRRFAAKFLELAGPIKEPVDAAPERTPPVTRRD